MNRSNALQNRFVIVEVARDRYSDSQSCSFLSWIVIRLGLELLTLCREKRSSSRNRLFGQCTRGSGFSVFMNLQCFANFKLLVGRKRQLELQLRCSRKQLFVVFAVASFMIITHLIGFCEYVSSHKPQAKVLGYYNQGPLRDVSSIYETEVNVRTGSNVVLDALLQDGHNPVLVSEVSNPVISHGPTNHTRLRSKGKGSRNQTDSSSGAAVVPKVVHYVLMGSDLRFTLVNYLSFLSVERFLKPHQIFVHSDVLPTGEWWNLVVKEVKNVYHVKRPYMDTAPNGQLLRFSAHSSDYIRGDILVRYGGIYLDGDVFVLKSFDPLLKHRTVLGRETALGVCNGIILAAKGAPFIRLMLEQYRSYEGETEEWASKSVENLHRLVLLYPHLVHLEETALHRPNWMEKIHLYHMNFDWSNNYAVHLFVRSWPEVVRPTTLEAALAIDTTFGEMTRAIVYGADRSNSSVSIKTARPILVGLLLQL